MEVVGALAGGLAQGEGTKGAGPLPRIEGGYGEGVMSVLKDKVGREQKNLRGKAQWVLWGLGSEAIRHHNSHREEKFLENS